MLHLMATSTQQSSHATNASKKMDITTFYNKLAFLVQYISEYNILIISGDKNPYIAKSENNNFSAYTTCQTEIVNI